MAVEPGALPFDKVIVRADGGMRVIAPSELLALPLHVRVRWLLDDSIEFHQGNQLVDRRAALAALRQASLGSPGR